MEKFKYILIIGCLLNVVQLCHGSPEKRKRSPEWPKYNAKLAEYEREHYQAYSSNTSLYTNWPEMKTNDELNEKTCQMYLQNLFTKKDFEQCMVISSLKFINLFYITNMSSSLGYLIREPLKLKSLLCRVDQLPTSIHRKYFHFIKAPSSECVYLTTRHPQGSLDFYISLRLCKGDSHYHMQDSKSLEGAIKKQKWLFQKKPRDHDIVVEQEEHERNHQFWVNQISVKADTWPELAGESPRMFCGKLLRKLYPRTSITLENVDPKYCFKNLIYTKLKNSDGFEFPPFIVIVISCEIMKNRNRGSHIFIRAPNHGSLNCVYMIRAANKSNKYLQIIKRLCIQKLYVNEEREGDITNIGVNVQMNNGNVSGPVTNEGHSIDSLKPIPIEEEGL